MWQYTETDELYHYGIPGMKWGVTKTRTYSRDIYRKGKKMHSKGDPADHSGIGVRTKISITKNKQPDKYNLADKKAAYKKANKEFDKSFNKAYNRAIAAYSPIKKHREANDQRWEDVGNKRDQLYKARNEYKSAKKAFKADKKSEAAAKKALAKAEKQQYRDYVKTRSKEIHAGRSLVGKIWDITTDAHKYAAALEYGTIRNKKKK